MRASEHPAGVEHGQGTKVSAVRESCFGSFSLEHTQNMCGVGERARKELGSWERRPSLAVYGFVTREHRTKSGRWWHIPVVCASRVMLCWWGCNNDALWGEVYVGCWSGREGVRRVAST